LSELLSTRETKEQERAKIKSIVQEMVEKDQVLDSVEMVTKEIKSSHGVEAKASLVQKVMRVDLGLRWRKIKEVSLQENSVRNLVLR
jgi:hypothetical protein